MYIALYRKYRPRTFSDVVGQDHITSTLMNEIVTGRDSHAYLFCGSRGTGKTTCAKILAKAVNCEHPVNGDPCNECDTCKGIDDGSILDVIEIDAASNNGVENIRDLRQEASFIPVNTKYRVYIIDEVHMLSGGAFNALLKTLEEPPEHVKFILATTEVHKLPATILSRCQRFDFKRISPEDISNRLKDIAVKENLSLEDDAAMLISRLADGALRDALSILDQCVNSDKTITTDTVNAAVGLADKSYLFELSECMASKNSAKALEIISELHNKSCDMERLETELIDHFRNMMIVKTVKAPEKLIVCTQNELLKIKECSELFSLSQILYNMDILSDSLTEIRRGMTPRIEIEMTVIKLCRAELIDHSVSDGASEIKQKRPAETVNKAKPAEKAEPAEEAKPVEKADHAEETKPETKTTQTVTGNLSETVLKKMVKAAARNEAMLTCVLDDASASFDGKKLYIYSSNILFSKMMAMNMNKQAIADAFYETTGNKCEVIPKDAPLNSSPPADFPKTQKPAESKKESDVLDGFADKFKDFDFFTEE